MNNYFHKTVLLHEAVDSLNIKPEGIYVDCTLGGGGHTKEILSKLGAGGRLIVFDHDEDAWQNAPTDDRVILIKENFQYLTKFLKYHKALPVDGILADLGVSSHHFDTSERGFSIREDGPLDMRMDKRISLTAEEIINTYSEIDLVRILGWYGEVSNSKTLAKLIVEKRQHQEFRGIDQFIQNISDAIRGPQNKYLAKVFQALRIEVNKELEVLEGLLDQCAACLVTGGRLVIISFHSLEDKLVKNKMKPELISVDSITGKSEYKQSFESLTKNPIVASEQEIAENKRSRSAKMRVAVKL